MLSNHVNESICFSKHWNNKNQLCCHLKWSLRTDFVFKRQHTNMEHFCRGTYSKEKPRSRQGNRRRRRGEDDIGEHQDAFQQEEADCSEWYQLLGWDHWWHSWKQVASRFKGCYDRPKLFLWNILESFLSAQWWIEWQMWKQSIGDVSRHQDHLRWIGFGDIWTQNWF